LRSAARIGAPEPQGAADGNGRRGRKLPRRPAVLASVSADTGRRRSDSGVFQTARAPDAARALQKSQPYYKPLRSSHVAFFANFSALKLQTAGLSLRFGVSNVIFQQSGGERILLKKRRESAIIRTDRIRRGAVPAGGGFLCLSAAARRQPREKISFEAADGESYMRSESGNPNDMEIRRHPKLG